MKLTWALVVLAALVNLGYYTFTEGGDFFAQLISTGFAPGLNPFEDTPAHDGRIPGFLLGVWHGFIAPVTFIVSLFTDDISIYSVHNSGALYDLGFLYSLLTWVNGLREVIGRIRALRTRPRPLRS